MNSRGNLKAYWYKADGTDLVFEPTLVQMADGDDIPFQNWAETGVTITGTGESFNPEAAGPDGQGNLTFDEHLVSPTGPVTAKITGHPAAECVLDLPPGGFTFSINVPSDNYSHSLPLSEVSGYTHDFTVDWGDESSSSVSSYNDPAKDHVYSLAGKYSANAAT